jgi:hypothetical protein
VPIEVGYIPINAVTGKVGPSTQVTGYSRGMAEVRRRGTTLGWLGVCCLAIFGTARFAPEIADTFALSTFGKLLVFGSLLTGVLLTTIAAIRGSKWWLVVVAAGAFTLLDLCVRLAQLTQLCRY